ncbi:hypothetical protein MYA98_02630 [Salmonella sp. WGH-01]|nr:hypothetical protein MYA98_02630 [Salmonella sp. WGH-01]
MSKEVEDAFEQLGVPVREGKEVAVDAIFDSVSVATTYREKLAEQGIIFCSFGEAIHDHPDRSGNILAPSCRGTITFCRAECGSRFRWDIYLCSQRRALPNGVIHLFSH